MKCKDCKSMKTPIRLHGCNDYWCYGVKEPFAIENIEHECTEYPQEYWNKRENVMQVNNKNYESKDEMVSHPSHYQSSIGLEVIDVIKAFTEDLNGIEATDTGNIIKYACRWSDKGTPVRDVEKIIWYATHLLNELKAKEVALNYTE